jgi:hypothetical protein
MCLGREHNTDNGEGNWLSAVEDAVDKGGNNPTRPVDKRRSKKDE